MRDVNGTPAHLVLGEAQWRGRLAADPAPAVWDDRRAGVVLRPIVERFALPAGDRVPRAEDRGAAAGLPGGTVVWTARDAAALLVSVPGETDEDRFWPDLPSAPPEPPPGDFAPAVPPVALPAGVRALAAIAGRALVAAIPGGLLVFDLRSGHPPLGLRWPAGELDAPLALASGPDGQVAVQDGTTGRVWRLDRATLAGAVALPPEGPGAFAPAVPLAPPVPPPSVTALDAAVALPGAADTLALALARRGELLAVVQAATGSAALVELAAAGPGTPLPLPAPTTAAVRLHDAVWLDVPPAPDRDPAVLGRLVGADASGNQAWSWRVSRAPGGALAAELEPLFLPMRRYDGTALASDRHVVRYHGIGGWSELVPQPRPRCERAAVVATEVLDSEVAGCTWHRVFIEGDLPVGAGLVVRAAGAEVRRLLIDEPAWIAQPDPVRRTDGHQPYTAPLGTAFELLLQGVQGRFARVAVELRSDGKRSPTVRSLEVTAPRFSLRDRYLPAVFTEEDTPDALLERFLANPEGMFTDLEGRIAAAQALLSPLAAPDDALAWLAGWLDLVLDPSFGDRRRRLFLRHAHRLLATRGTPQGLQLALRLALDPTVDDEALTDPRQAPTAAIRIIEGYQLRHSRAVAAGDPTAEAQASDPQLRWRPVDGAAALHARWEAATGDPVFPPRPKTITTEWLDFCDRELGYRPGTTATDDARWRVFLERRHGTLALAAAAHGIPVPAVRAWPRRLPEAPAPLRDWHDAGAVVLAAARFAHRFTVLLPVATGDRPDDAAVAERRRLAERVLAVQKPAHTVARVRLYWSAFRVGYARLGSDSAIADRVPLQHDAVLGLRAIGETVLGGPRRPLADAPTSLDPAAACGCPHEPSRRDDDD